MSTKKKIKSLSTRKIIVTFRAILFIAFFILGLFSGEMDFLYDVHENGHIIWAEDAGYKAERTSKNSMRFYGERTVEITNGGYFHEVWLMFGITLLAMGICRSQYWMCAWPLALMHVCFFRYFGSFDATVGVPGYLTNISYIINTAWMFLIIYPILILRKFWPEMEYYKEGVRHSLFTRKTAYQFER